MYRTGSARYKSIRNNALLQRKDDLHIKKMTSPIAKKALHGWANLDFRCAGSISHDETYVSIPVCTVTFHQHEHRTQCDK